MGKREYKCVCMTFYVAIYHFVLMALLNLTVDVGPTQKKRTNGKNLLFKLERGKKKKERKRNSNLLKLGYPLGTSALGHKTILHIICSFGI